MDFAHTALLASIDHTLASIRAALAASRDPEQTAETRTRLAATAGSDSARLVVEAGPANWPGVDPAVFEAIRRVEEPAHRDDLAGMERALAEAREMLGGPSA